MSFLIQHQLLNNQKRRFDPKNKKDIELFIMFLSEHRWKEPCPFLLEEPHTVIPEMLKDKYIRSQFSIPEPMPEILR
jgi:hypothetical protein